MLKRSAVLQMCIDDESIVKRISTIKSSIAFRAVTYMTSQFIHWWFCMHMKNRTHHIVNEGKSLKQAVRPLSPMIGRVMNM
ncbi:MAG: hypothetical protein BGN99_08420 [Alphaproteobacteria bacterium 65-37]|nr:MAG: hypothetical protein BGN99_08420 [Alphaproteobacteria bacterium 65-37]